MSFEQSDKEEYLQLVRSAKDTNFVNQALLDKVIEQRKLILMLRAELRTKGK